jgi:hypothetical protein
MSKPADPRKRVKMMSRRELVDWLDMALSGAQRHLDDYRRTGDTASLGEINIGLTAINLVVDELVLHAEAEAEE